MKPINAINGVITAHALEYFDEFSNLGIEYLGDHGYFSRFEFSLISGVNYVDTKRLNSFEDGVQAELSRVYRKDYQEVRVITHVTSIPDGIKIEGKVDFYHPQNHVKGAIIVMED